MRACVCVCVCDCLLSLCVSYSFVIASKHITACVCLCAEMYWRACESRVLNTFRVCVCERERDREACDLGVRDDSGMLESGVRCVCVCL